jgi:hypothetical protein
MRFKALFLVVAAVLLIPQAASAQYDPAGRRYDDGYRGPAPMPPVGPPPGQYEQRRYREPPPQVYRQRGLFCAPEGGYCRFQGPAIVRYGAGGRFTTRRAFDGIPCNNNVFGDPYPGADKACFLD